MWVLVTAFLVFFMQAGFMFLEAGFARRRETVNVLLEGVVDTCLCGILFYAWGFAWMFGHGNGFIGWGDAGAGHSWYFLQHLPDTYEATGVATLAFVLCSNSPSPSTPARRSPPAPCSDAPVSGAISGTASG